MKILFENPRRGDIAIYDCNGSGKISRLIDRKYSKTVIYTRGEQINITPKIIWGVVSLLCDNYGFMFPWRLLKRPGIIRVVYFAALIRIINPKAVITNIDNDPRFHFLSNYLCLRFISIQNGCRDRHTLSEMAKTTAPENNHIYMCYGEYERDILRSEGSDIRGIVPVGAIEPCLLHNINGVGSKRYDICLISEWDENMAYIPDFYACMKDFHVHLNRYRIKYDKRLIIAMRHGSDQERTYYKITFGDGITLVDRDDIAMNTHVSISNSDLVVSVASSACLHAFILKKKNLYFDYSIRRYCVVENDRIVMRNSSYEELEAIMNKIAPMSYDEYVDYVDGLEYYMHVSRDPGRKMYELIEFAISGGDCEQLRYMSKC